MASYFVLLTCRIIALTSFFPYLQIVPLTDKCTIQETHSLQLMAVIHGTPFSSSLSLPLSVLLFSSFLFASLHISIPSCLISVSVLNMVLACVQRLDAVSVYIHVAIARVTLCHVHVYLTHRLPEWRN